MKLMKNWVRAYGYCVNIYERRRKYHFVDQVETQKKTFKKIITFAKAMYTYWNYTVDMQIIHLVFEKKDDLKIQDMAVMKDIANMFRHITHNQDRSTIIPGEYKKMKKQAVVLLFYQVVDVCYQTWNICTNVSFILQGKL